MCKHPKENDTDTIIESIQEFKNEQKETIKNIINSVENQTTTIENGIKAINNQISDIKKKIDKHTSVLDDQIKDIRKGNTEIKPHRLLYTILIIIFTIIMAMLFLPFTCPAQTTEKCCCKKCCYKNTGAEVSPVTIQFVDNFNKPLKEICLDSMVKKQNIIISSDGIIFTSQCKLWPLVIFRIALAIILLFTLMFALKFLVPYWTRIAELKDKQHERKMKYDEEEREYERLQKRTDISIQDREARADIDENAKDADHNRKIEIMRQEYQTHLADVALEMVKLSNSSKEQETINQIIQRLINQK